MKLFRIALIGSLSLLILLAMVSARARTVESRPVLYQETGHTLAYSFRQFYESNGALKTFGFPLTEVFIEDGRPVQYFERTRLEWHASLHMVQGGHLGRWAAQKKQHLPAFKPLQRVSTDGIFFPQTRHSMQGPFLDFWQNNGGLVTFGYPISEEFNEYYPIERKMYTVQYFERAKLELHSDQPDGNQIMVSLLGQEYLEYHPAPDHAIRPVTSALEAWNSVRPGRVRISRIGLDTDVIEAAHSGDEWDIPHDTAAHYWPVSAYPQSAGNIIIAGRAGSGDMGFNQLPRVQVGDEVFVTVDRHERRYVVREVMYVLPDDSWVLQQTPTETLTLMAHVPERRYENRLVVRAEPRPLVE